MSLRKEVYDQVGLRDLRAERTWPHFLGQSWRRKWVWAPQWAPECFSAWLGVSQEGVDCPQIWRCPMVRWAAYNSRRQQGHCSGPWSGQECQREGHLPWCQDEPMMTKDQRQPPYPAPCYNQHIWEVGCCLGGEEGENTQMTKNISRDQVFLELGLSFCHEEWEMETKMTPQKNREKKHLTACGIWTYCILPFWDTVHIIQIFKNKPLF